MFSFRVGKPRAKFPARRALGIKSAGRQQPDRRHRQAGQPEDDRSAGQRKNRDEEGICQSHESAARKDGPPLPCPRIGLPAVDNGEADEQEAEKAAAAPVLAMKKLSYWPNTRATLWPVTSQARR